MIFLKLKNWQRISHKCLFMCPVNDWWSHIACFILSVIFIIKLYSQVKFGNKEQCLLSWTNENTCSQLTGTPLTTILISFFCVCLHFFVRLIFWQRKGTRNVWGDWLCCVRHANVCVCVCLDVEWRPCLSRRAIFSGPLCVLLFSPPLFFLCAACSI